jgi:hypothetical protein
MKNLKPFSAHLNEGEWWDNDPSAPWNQPDPEDPEATIEYTKAAQLFEIPAYVPDNYAVLKKKDDGSLWVLDARDILDSGGEFDDFIFYVHYEDEIHLAEDMEDESYINIATDLYKENKFVNDPSADAIEEADGEERLFRLTEPLAAWIIEDSLYSSKKRDQKYFSDKRAQDYRKVANFVSRAFPDIDI